MEEPHLPGPQGCRTADWRRLQNWIANIESQKSVVNPNKVWISPYMKERIIWMKWRINTLRIHELIGKDDAGT